MFVLQLSIVITLAAYVFSAPTPGSTASFYIQAVSKNTSINGQRFGTCHIGAALESICLYPNDTAVFQINSTSNQPVLPAGVVAEGILAWFLTISGGQQVPQAMSLDQDYGSNVAAAHLGFAEPTSAVAIDRAQRLGLLSFIDDAVVPPQSTGGTFLSYWHVCQNNYAGYVYNTLSWVYGGKAPTQPSCVKTDLKVVYQ